MRNQIFQQVEMTRPRSNIFDLSHERKLSTKMGRLTPISIIDCIPGDKITIQPNVMIRFAPLLAPVMHRINIYCHFFFVPHRLSWPASSGGGFEAFITSGQQGLENPAWPYISFDFSNNTIGSLADYLNLPTVTDVPDVATQDISALPFHAYQLIYNEYYRDENLDVENLPPLDFGEQSPADTIRLKTLRYRAWEHDYFTSALPWSQKGPEALLPLAGKAPVTAYTDPGTGTFNPSQFRDPFTGVTQTFPGSSNIEIDTAGENIGVAGDPYYIDLRGSNYADLSQSTTTSISDLRRAIALQIWLEKNSRGGTRYTESMLANFGVHSSDARLQRPQYIGGTVSPVSISEVLQTSGTSLTPQGNMAGHGISVNGGGYSSFRAEEHGYLMGIMSVLPTTAYQQGIPKHFLRSDRFDYFWPDFAHIGEQPIENQEIMAGHLLGATATFGYTPRYAEYKFINSSVHGDYRTTLDFWHLGRKFNPAFPPTLNSAFVHVNPIEVERIFAVQDDSDNLWCHIINTVKAKRLMPIFGNPSKF